jgi:tRNA (guanine-N1)-methyltransferase
MERKPLNIDILTLFPGFFEGPLSTSIVKRAIDKGLLQVSCRDIRDWSEGTYRQVDDMPYGGGPGMVLMLEPLSACIESVMAEHRSRSLEPRLLIMCPRGKTLKQEDLVRWSCIDADSESIIMLAGHYEGFDERLYSLFRWEIVSLGDFVLSGGELPAMAVVDGVARLLDGTLGNPDSLSHESFNAGLLDHPVYTRPAEFRGLIVPKILLEGDSAKIETWRSMKRRELTSRYRPDLLEKGSQNKTLGNESASDAGSDTE